MKEKFNIYETITERIMSALKNDKKLIVTATGKAQKAIDYILLSKI